MEDMGEVDWITARAACSLPAVFERLRVGAERDVATRNTQTPVRADYIFRFAAHPPDTFTVAREGVSTMKPYTVWVRLTATAIVITSDADEPAIRVTLTLNPEGHCRCVVDGAEVPEWYVRKVAFEACLFGPLF